MRFSLLPASWPLTPENLSLADYRLAELALALPVSAALELPLLALRATTREAPLEGPDMPPRALVCMLHKDLYLSAFAPSFWEALGPDFAYLAFHGFASYVGMIWPNLRGYQAFRYQLKTAKRSSERARPLAQTLSFLEKHLGRFALRTDAGGPYGRVRASLVDMAIASDRPVVVVRQCADRTTHVRGHALPLPGAQVKSRVSRAVDPSSLRLLDREGGRELLQRLLDEL